MRGIAFLAGVCLLTLASSSTAASLTDGIVAYYPLEVGLEDVSGNEHDGVSLGAGISYTMGVVGAAAEFDGRWGTGVDTGTWNPSEHTGQFSVACWVRYLSGGDSLRQGLVAKRDAWADGEFYWYLEMNETPDRVGIDSVYFAGRQAEASTSVLTPQQGQWCFVVGTYDGQTARLFVDANNYAAQDWTLDPQDADNHVVFGCAGNHGENPFSGALDEIVIWDRALSQDEVLQLYNNGQGLRLAIDYEPKSFLDNAGFEQQVLADGEWVSGEVSSWSLPAGGEGGVLNPTSNSLPGEAPEGQNILWLTDGSLTQGSQMVVQEGVLHRLEVRAASRSGSASRTVVSMRSGRTLLASYDGYVSGGFRNIVVDYVPPDGGSTIGRTIGVTLSNGDKVGGTYFDDVRLTAYLADCNGNGVPDVEESGLDDGDGDGIPDTCDQPSVRNITRGTVHYTIQGAVDAAVEHDEIEVGPGTYREAIELRGKAIILRSLGGSGETIIDGKGHLNVVRFVGPEQDDTVMDGFTITGGDASGQTYWRYVGGGVYCVGGDPTIANCIVSGNRARFGGGMYCDRSAAVVTNCIFTGNLALQRGGGMYNYYEGNPVVTNCLFNGNRTDGAGAAWFNFGGNATITNCTFIENWAQGGDTVTCNSLAGTDPNTLRFANCILWDGEDWLVVLDQTQVVIDFSDVRGGWAGPGANNIDIDPRFVNRAGPGNNPGDLDDNLRLKSTSPCIDAGSSWLMPTDLGDLDKDGNRKEAVPFDLDGQPRYADDPTTEDSGMAVYDILPVVDMGAYEHFGMTPVEGDVNRDGVVDFRDAALMAGNWLAGLK